MSLTIAQTPVHPLRRLAEWLARDRVVRRALPADFGGRPVFFSPGNRLRAWLPDVERIEPELIALVRRLVRPGMQVWDVGANMGAFALPAAHRVGPRGRVLAVEPDPFNQLLLHRSLAHPRNRDLALTVVPAALSDGIGMAELTVAARGRAANSLKGAAHGSQMGAHRTSLPVVTLTLDWLAERFSPPDLVKCDAEGAETWILAGAAHLLRTARPVFVMEVPHENAESCTDRFHAADYRLFPADRPIEPSRALPEIADAWEIIAIPAERLSLHAGR